MIVTGRRWIRAALAVTAVVALTITGAPASWADDLGPTRPSSNERTRGLVALGDSYASGEGTFAYRTGTDTATNQCHRSPWAYAALAGKLLHRVGPTRLVACSGTGTAALLDPDERNAEPAQVDALSRTTRYVTLTTGGNDVGFSTVLGACVLAGTRGKTCSTDPALALLIDGGLAQLSGAADSSPQGYSLDRVLREIAQRSPNADIVVTGYPELFGSDAADATPSPLAPGGAVCVVEPTWKLGLSFADTQWLNAQTRRLDGVLAAAVRSAQRLGIRVRYADPVPEFRGHGLCDAKQAWINPLTVTNPATLAVEPESLHPTRRGQFAYLRAVLR